MKSLVPQFPPAAAKVIARDAFGIDGEVVGLPSERDQNFHITAAGGDEFVLKIANQAEDQAFLEAQNRVLDTIAGREPLLGTPRIVQTVSKNEIAEVTGGMGQVHAVRMLTYLSGDPVAAGPKDASVLNQIGVFLGRVDRALEGFEDSALQRQIEWDLEHAGDVVGRYLPDVPAEMRPAIERWLRRFEGDVAPLLPDLRKGVIHNDGNDYNILTADRGDGRMVAGIVDFGDMVESRLVFEVAVAAAYGLLGEAAPWRAASCVASGYDAVCPLEELEWEVLPELIAMRLCVSLAKSAHQQRVDPANEYLVISQRPAWEALQLLDEQRVHAARAVLRGHGETRSVPRRSTNELLEARRQSIGPSLSLSYREPLHIVRGWMQYLYDDTGRAYLDAVNNVCHVGHAHPRVVRAAQRQIERLNTNTRYLHENLVEYAERLCALFPDPLAVCYLVCSGSEANELALRLARCHTSGTDVIVLRGAYHGNTSALVDMSPYKHDGPGGRGAPSSVHAVPIPDVYRDGIDAEGAGARYAGAVRDAAAAIREDGGNLAAFFCESLPGCAGQIVLPDDYLRTAYDFVRDAGGVCVADEVQVGFGRVGETFWGFELQGVTPDIVTLGKPIGNGHPIGAVITTRELAASFDNGMEYFNTFGGNPVSCAVGLAVLDVIEDEGLQDRAHRVGSYLHDRLQQLATSQEAIGDVRGVGLFLGVELVGSRETREPDGRLAGVVAEKMKDHGVLISTDGPFHNVLKIKPPLQFTRRDADFLVATLDAALRECAVDDADSA